ncbi:MAG: peptidoglycan-binding protein [Bacteroidota bacterium]
MLIPVNPQGEPLPVGQWSRVLMGEQFYAKTTELNQPTLHKNPLPIAQGEIRVREKTGNNDGERVEEYLACVDLKKGQPYCAAFVSWVFKQAGYASPRTGWSPSLFPTSRLVAVAMPGNVLGIYFPALNRIAHCGFVEKVNGDLITSIEGNTDGSGGREGDGVYRRIRNRKSIRYYADWVTPIGQLKKGKS